MYIVYLSLVFHITQQTRSFSSDSSPDVCFLPREGAEFCAWQECEEEEGEDEGGGQSSVCAQRRGAAL